MTNGKRVALALAAVLALAGCASNHPGPPVPNVIGMAGDDARGTLTDAGYKTEWANPGPTVVIAGDWVVSGETPRNAAKGATITLTVVRPTVSAAPVEATSKGLTGTAAQAACDRRISQEFPYGADPHWIVGALANEIQNDQWFLKVKATVKNAYNAKRDVDIECRVDGTDDAPQVVEFNSY